MNWRRTQRALCMLLIAAFLLPLFTGCSSLTKGRGEKGTLSPDTTRVGSDRLSLDMGEFPLDEEAKCGIKPVDAPKMEDVNINAYEFNIETDEELLSVMGLTIPYDEKELGGLDPEGNVGAAYFNEETQAWEPVSFTVNDNGTVTIYTEHLSTYGCFVTKNDNTRRAYVSYVMPESAYINAYKTDADNVIAETVKNSGNPSESALELGIEALDLTLEIAGAGVDAASYVQNAGVSPSILHQIAQNPANSPMLGKLGDKLGSFGVAVAAAQVAMGMYEISNGNTDKIIPCYREALKGSMSYIGGKAASKLFGIAFLGVLVIDYSINKFGEEAWKARTDIYRKAYNHYYENRVEGKRKGERTARDWARVFLDARKTARSAEAYNIRIQGLVDRYVNEAWKDPEKVFEYVSDDMKQSGVAMGGGGYTETVRKRISDEYAKELYCGVLQEAFKLIADRDVRVAQANVRKELNVVKAEMNKICTLELYDSTVTDSKTKSDMAGATVSVTLPDNITDKAR